MLWDHFDESAKDLQAPKATSQPDQCTGDAHVRNMGRELTLSDVSPTVLQLITPGKCYPVLFYGAMVCYYCRVAWG